MVESTNVRAGLRAEDACAGRTSRPAVAFGLRMAALAGILVGADGVAAAAWADGTTAAPEIAVAAEPPPTELPLEVNPSTCC